MHFAKAVPPPILYHGTSLYITHTILKRGIKPMSRHNVQQQQASQHQLGGLHKPGAERASETWHAIVEPMRYVQKASQNEEANQVPPLALHQG
jgi:hypothetical protein